MGANASLLKYAAIAMIVSSYSILMFTPQGRVISRILKALGVVIVRRATGKTINPKWSLMMETQQKLVAGMNFGNVKETNAIFDNIPPLPLPSSIKIEKNIKITDTLTADFVYDITNSSNTTSAILYLHGGAFCYLHPNAYYSVASRISSATKMKVFMPDYRLAPQHPFPAALHDCVAAYQHLLSLGFSSIFIIGDSAGGGLTMSTQLYLRDKTTAKLPTAACCLSPWVDLRGAPTSYNQFKQTDLFGENGIEVWTKCNHLYAGDKIDDVLVSPVLGNMKGLPPLLIVVGEEQLMSNSIDLYKRYKECGCDDVTLSVYSGMYHNFIMLSKRDCEESEKLVKQISDFITKYN